MAQQRRRRIRTIEEEIPDERDDMQPDHAAVYEDPDSDVKRLMEDGTAGEIRIKLYRVLVSGTEEFKAWLPVVKDPESYIQETWGEGKYVLKYYKDGILRGSRVVNIGAPVGSKENPQVITAAASNPVLDLVMAQNKILMEALVNGRGREQTPVGELIQGMAGLQNLTGGGNNAESMMKVFLDGINMGRSMGAEPEDKGGFSGIIKDLLPAFLAGMNGAKTALPAAAPAPNPAGEVQAMDEKTQLAPLIGFLKSQAIAGVDPGAFIHMAVQNRSTDQFRPLIAYVLQNTFETIQSLDSELTKEPYAEWFRLLVDGLRSQIKAADSMADDSGGDVGDDGNIVTDEKLRKRRRGTS